MLEKKIKLAIHMDQGGFSDRWIKYCRQKELHYEIVNCFDSDIIKKIRHVDGLLWHWKHDDPAAQTAARQIIQSAELVGIRVFPNTSTCWYYDDKLAQKYILESIDAPHVPSYVFFDSRKAKEWVKNTDFPKVFKLRCGAGAQNVKLVKSKNEAIDICNKAFRKGFRSNIGYLNDCQTKMRRVQSSKALYEKIKRFPKVISNIHRKHVLLSKQIGYVYFQDFLPDNSYDTRIVVVGNRAVGTVRQNRPNDFRASGSGIACHERDKIDQRCIKIAFNVVERLKAQSLAFDFIYDKQHMPRIIEFSYCFPPQKEYKSVGYWDRSLAWHDEKVCPEFFIIEDLVSDILSNRQHSPTLVHYE